jgi:hemerythrin-like domain-containing protein
MATASKGPIAKRQRSTSKRNGSTGNSRMDAITLLKQDHTKVRGLLSTLAATTERAMEKRKQLLKEIETEIKMHSKLEEELFYPAYKEAVSKANEHIYHESLEEHHLVDIVLLEFKVTTAGSESFGAKAKVLKDLIEHHAEEEETEMFPKARKAMGAEHLRRLGEQMQERRQSLQSTMLTRVAMAAGSTLGKVLHRGKRAA